MGQEYEAAMNCLSSLSTRRVRGDESNNGDRFDLMFHYLKILDLEDATSRLKIIHVAGTKGKGSTCSFAEAILRYCGFRTGLYTGPHLIDFQERYRLDGEQVSEKKFLEHFWWCWNRLKEKTSDDIPMPTFFRFTALFAFRLFSAEQVDVAIFEVGLGGKYDSTNVVQAPIVCGISSLGYDHMEILGHTLREIAGVKAGIFKQGVPAYTVSQPEEAMHALEEKASELGAPLQEVSPLDRGLLRGQRLGLDGEHQFINAGLAVALSIEWLIRTGNMNDMHLDKNTLPEPFIRGLSSASMMGRAQVVPNPLMQPNNSSQGSLIFYLDGAHTPESLEVCGKWFCNSINKDAHLFEERSYKIHSSRNEGCPDSARAGNLPILLFNCMSVRDPKLLLPRLVNICSQNGKSHEEEHNRVGLKFHRAIFVRNQSMNKKVISHASPTIDPEQVDLTWQLTIQREWNKLNQAEQGSESLVFPSLLLAISWLREIARQRRSIKFQVLVTGSLYLVGDVLRIIKN